MINLQDIRSLLVKIKNSHSMATNFKLDAKDTTNRVEYIEKPYIYRNIWYGTRLFSGIETIFMKDRAIWSLSYRGRILDDNIDIVDIVNFLKEALCATSVLNPYRGPENYLSDKFAYECIYFGNLELCHGNEFIYMEGKKIYELSFSSWVIR